MNSPPPRLAGETRPDQRDLYFHLHELCLLPHSVIYNTTREYGGVNVKGGQERVRLLVKGEKFDTVMAAISSHPGTMQVVLELQKCKPLTPEQVALLNADKTKK